MKIILEKGEKNLIDNINKDLEDNKEIPFLFINKKGSKYYLEFECDDIAKANTFVMYMMSPNKEMQENIRENFGINITAFSYCSPKEREIENLKNILRETLEKLENM